MDQKRRRQSKPKDEWREELIKKARNAVEGYEEYLMNRLNYLELASIMKDLQNHLNEEKKQK